MIIDDTCDESVMKVRMRVVEDDKYCCSVPVDQYTRDFQVA